MDPSPSTEHPEQVLESKVLPESGINNLAGNRHKLPAFRADICSLATFPDLIVVRHVDIEDQFTLHCFNVANCAVLLWADGHDGADVYFVRIPVANLLLELLGGLKGQIAQVNVIGQGE